MIDDSEPEATIFYSKAEVPVVGLVHQPNHKTFDLQSILPEKCAGALVSQNLCEWSTNNWFNLRPMP